MIPEYLSVQDVADRTGLAPTTVRQYHWRGNMPPADATVGQSPLWKEKTINEWLKTRPSATWTRRKKKP